MELKIENCALKIAPYNKVNIEEMYPIYAVMCQKESTVLYFIFLQYLPA